jgi:hypothetical protein
MKRHGRHRKKKSNPNSGFSMAEVLVAAIVLFVMLLSANKAVLVGMASTRQATSRASIESEILNDIETIQGIDSSLSADFNGCGTGGGANYLKTKVDILNPVNIGRNWQRTLDSTDPNILLIIYSFTIPEFVGTGTGTEKRVVEINPSFLTECPT